MPELLGIVAMSALLVGAALRERALYRRRHWVEWLGRILWRSHPAVIALTGAFRRVIEAAREAEEATMKLRAEMEGEG